MWNDFEPIGLSWPILVAKVTAIGAVCGSSAGVLYALLFS